MLTTLRNVLTTVTPKVFYSNNEYDNDGVENPPFIIIQEISKRASVFSDNKPVFYVSDIQITLVTSKKDVALEQSLETTLLEHDYTYQVLSEYKNSDGSRYRVYELRLEDIIYA